MLTDDGDNPLSAEPAARRPLARAKRVAEPETPSRTQRAEPEAAPTTEVTLPTPGVVICFRVFCTILSLGAIIGAGCSFMTLSNDFYYSSYYDRDLSDGHWEFTGYLLLSLAAFAIFSIPLLFPRSKPWMWWYGLIVIFIPILSVWLTVFGILLLIFWVMPRSQRYFCRMVVVPPPPRRRGRYYPDDDDDDDFDD